MLINLVIALRSLKRDGEAHRASRHTLTLEADYTSPYHVAWLALDDAIEGRVGAASRRLADLESATLDATNRFLVALSTALVGIQRASRGDRAAVFSEARRALASAAVASPIPADDHAAIFHAYRRAVRRIGSDVGGLVARTWSGFRWVQPRVTKLP
jgi:hypothetical protein